MLCVCVHVKMCVFRESTYVNILYIGGDCKHFVCSGRVRIRYMCAFLGRVCVLRNVCSGSVLMLACVRRGGECVCARVVCK